MGLNPETQFPGKIEPSSPEYPYGEARNVTVSGDGTGTPWIAALTNDLFGLQQTLLSEAGIVPSGNPDTVVDSDYFNAFRLLFGRAVKNIVDLRLEEGVAQGQLMDVLGHTVAGDGGGGPPRTWNVGAGQIDDGVSIVVPGGIIGTPSTTGAWVWPEGSVVSYRAWGGIVEAVTGIGSSQVKLTIDAPFELAADLVVPRNIELIWNINSLASASGPFTLTLLRRPRAGRYQLFDETVTAQAGSGLGQKFPSGHAEWWGLSEAGTDALNSIALQASVDNASSCAWPAGTYAYDVGLVIDTAGKWGGLSSCGAAGNSGGEPDVNTTRIIYTGTGRGIDVVGSGTEGKENIHLHDFSLWDGSGFLASAGLYLGSGVLVTKSSFKNIHLKNFQKVGAFGLEIGKCLESIFENVYAQDCYDGIGSLNGTMTTLNFTSCWSRTNLRYGWSFNSAVGNGSSFYNCLAEGNGDAGLVLDGVRSMDFINWYSEANNLTSFTTPIIIGNSTLANNIRFFGGTIDDAVGGTSVRLDNAERVVFYDMSLTTFNNGFMTASANTLQCAFYTTSGAGLVAGVASGVNVVDAKLRDSVRPSFLANITASQNNVTGDGTSYDLTGPIWTEDHNVASGFTNGTFTAPIVGNYSFSGIWNLRGLTVAHTNIILQLVTTGGTYLMGLYGSGAANVSGDLALAGSLCSVPMDLGDTAILNVIVQNGTIVVDIDPTTIFSGFLNP